MSEEIRHYHSDKCRDCGAILPADDWSSVICNRCAEQEDLAMFWREVARLHRLYGVESDRVIPSDEIPAHRGCS